MESGGAARRNRVSAADLNRESEDELERIVRSRIGDVQMDGSFELPARALAAGNSRVLL
jgi:hypothetical protein